MLGYQAGYNEHGSNKLYIENSSADSTTALIYGEFDNDKIIMNASVGIGTTAPLMNLAIGDGGSGFTGSSGNLTLKTSNTTRVAITTTETQISNRVKITSAEPIMASGDLNFGSGNSSTVKMLLSSAGYLGIGSSSPACPLDVAGSSANLGAMTGYTYPSNGQASYSSLPNINIRAASNMAANAYLAFSDERIKNIIGISDSVKDIETISRLKITDYKYIDIFNKGNLPQKKLIAQQTKEIYPQAVFTSSDFIPNIFEKPDKINDF